MHGSGLTKPADILQYAWRGDQDCCVDLVSVSPARMGWRDATSALFSVEQGESDKHARSYISHVFDFSPFGFSTFGSFGPAAEELLDLLCHRYVSHAHIPPWEAHPWVYHRLSFFFMRGVAEQFVRLQSADFGW